jgi:hypothetical protein
MNVTCRNRNLKMSDILTCYLTSIKGKTTELQMILRMNEFNVENHEKSFLKKMTFCDNM